MAAVIEVTRTSLRLLVAEGEGKSVRVRRFLVEPIGAPQEAGARLPLLIKQAKLDGAEAIVTIAREQVITRMLKLPAVRPEELGRMVELSGKAQLPFPREQAVADYQVLEQSGGATTVQLIACHRQVVDHAVALARQAGCDPIALVPSSWGVLAWYQQLGRAAEIPEPAMVINVDGDHTDLLLVERGRLLFSRSLAQGVAEWQAGDPAALLAEEIGRSVSGMRKELPGVEAAGIVLTGVGPLADWRAGLAQQVGKPVAVRQLQHRELAIAGNASGVVAVGLAMAEPRLLPNLLPPDARHAQRSRRQMRQLSWTGALLGVCLVLGVLALSLSAHRQEERTQRLLTRVTELERQAKQAQRQQADVELIERTLAARRRLASQLVDALRLAPPEVMFDDISLERSRQELSIRGNAPSTRHVLDFIKQLEDTNQFERVELRYSARRNRPGGASTEFQVVARVPAA
jgi:Tfp pilus assembly protein PilN